jgi:hypothetical protein
MPFKSDLDNTPIDLHEVMYGARPDAAWNSLISDTLSVTTTAQTLEELLNAKDHDVVDEVAAAADGVTMEFSGTLAPHPYFFIEDNDSVTFTATVSAGSVDITDVTTPGILAGTNCTGTIDYVTGEWTLVFTVTAPDDATNIVVDYTWFYTLPPTVNGLWMYPESEVRATFSASNTPTTATGIPLTEPILLAGQPNLIAAAQFIAAGTTDLSVEVMV